MSELAQPEPLPHLVRLDRRIVACYARIGSAETRQGAVATTFAVGTMQIVAAVTTYNLLAPLSLAIAIATAAIMFIWYALVADMCEPRVSLAGTHRKGYPVKAAQIVVAAVTLTFVLAGVTALLLSVGSEYAFGALFATVFFAGDAPFKAAWRRQYQLVAADSGLVDDSPTGDSPSGHRHEGRDEELIAQLEQRDIPTGDQEDAGDVRGRRA